VIKIGELFGTDPGSSSIIFLHIEMGSSF